MVFTQEQQQQAAHLFGLIKRQLSMGVEPSVVIYVLAAATGQTAAEVGLSAEDLEKLLPAMRQAHAGHTAGQKQAKVNPHG